MFKYQQLFRIYFSIRVEYGKKYNLGAGSGPTGPFDSLIVFIIVVVVVVVFSVKVDPEKKTI